MMSRKESRVVVIGAGAVGLSTAVCIQQNLPNTSVTVVADMFTSDTLSHGTPAIFIPNIVNIPRMTPDLYRHVT